MNVQELIDELTKVEDKTLPVYGCAYPIDSHTGPDAVEEEIESVEVGQVVDYSSPGRMVTGTTAFGTRRSWYESATKTAVKLELR